MSATVPIGGQELPLLFPSERLPWRFQVERSLIERFGEAAVIEGAAQWDGIAGSRWATSYAGMSEAGAAADGRSVIFTKTDCPSGVGGYTYWQTQQAPTLQRYGTGAVFVPEVDIAVCSAVQTVDGLKQVLAHEVGHAFGLEHLCDPGQECWRPGMGLGPHDCRVLYAHGSGCLRRITGAEHPGVVHLYPTLRRLSGPSRVETAARASFASYDRETAPAVVVARGDRTAHGPLAAAALSGTLKAPLLLGAPGGNECITGAAAEELARAAARDARVILVGEWPATCLSTLLQWQLSPTHVDGATVTELGLAVARDAVSAGASPKLVFLVSAHPDTHGHVPDGVAAAAAAGASGGVVLFTDPQRLTPGVARWLRDHSAGGRVYLMGGEAALTTQVASDAAATGAEVVRVAGRTRIDTALALANHKDLFGSGAVILAAAGSWADAVTGSSLGGRTATPVLLTSRGGDPAVEQWLALQRPIGGYVVGGGAVLPYELQWHYARYVR